jgi:glycine/D-amino acid oxidase-like deaminating enzyme
MDLRTGTSYWLAADGQLGEYPALQRDMRCDVAVLGGGVTGALIADALIREGADVIVVDKRRFGHGSTAATTGLLQYELDTSLCELTERIGAHDAARAYLLGIEAIDQIERIVDDLGDPCGFERKQSLYLASNEDDVADLALRVRCSTRHRN